MYLLDKMPVHMAVQFGTITIDLRSLYARHNISSPTSKNTPSNRHKHSNDKLTD